MLSSPLLEPILLPTPSCRSLCCLHLPWDQLRCYPWCARQIRACNMPASWRTLSHSSHFKMDPTPLVEVLEDSPPIVGEDLMSAILTLFVACPSSNHTDGGHVEPWLGPNLVNPCKFNNHVKVLRPGDVFLIIQVNFNLKRKVNRHLPPTRCWQSPWQTWWCLPKGNHFHVCFFELEAPLVIKKYSWSCCGSVKLLP